MEQSNNKKRENVFKVINFVFMFLFMIAVVWVFATGNTDNFTGANNYVSKAEFEAYKADQEKRDNEILGVIKGVQKNIDGILINMQEMQEIDAGIVDILDKMN